MNVKILTWTILAVGLLLLAGISSFSPTAAEPQGGAITRRVSVASDGTEANDDSNYAAISADGRYVAFLSYATNLVPNDTNGVKDVFVHDLQTGQTSRVSVASDGSQANFRSGDFEAPSLSADGRFIAFVSVASNLVQNDTNNQQDVFVRDHVTGQTVLVSIASDGSQGSLWAAKPAISADGQFVVFVTASPLVAGDTNGVADIFVHDRDFDRDGIFDEPGQINTVRVSVASDGTQANGTSGYTDIAISDDGRHISFDSYATNLVPDDTNDRQDTFVHDRDKDADGVFDEPGAIRTVRVSIANDGTEGNGHSSDSEISGDGRYVTFWSRASNLVPGDTQSCSAGNCYDVFIHDRDPDGDGIFDQSGQTWIEMASVASDGSQGNNHSYYPSISANSQFVAFYSIAGNLVPGDTAWVDIFVRDRVFGETFRASLTDSLGQANGSSFMPDLSGDGQLVAFDSVASNLVAGDTNNRYDIFVHDMVSALFTPTPTYTPTNTPTLTPTPSPTPTEMPEPLPAADWQIQTLDVRGRTGQHASMALDTSGFPHISYAAEEGLSRSLKYMRWDGVVWHVTTVDSSADVGEYTDIALDSNDRAHISYRDDTNGSLKYARWTGSAWDVQTAVFGPGVGFHTAIAVAPISNITHMVYYDFLQERLSHVYWNGANWFPRLVDAGPEVGLGSDLVFDLFGVLHISYYDGSAGDLHYGTFDGQAWNTQVVNSTDDVGKHNSLAFDSQNQPHISYYDATLDALKYAHFNGMSWQVEYVNINGQGGQHTSIALDSGDVPFISYFDGSQLLLAEETGASWTITPIDSDGQVGWYSSLALDGADVPHIAYYDESYGDLKYVDYGPHWEFRQIDMGTDSRLPSLDMDRAVPGMSFHNSFAIPDQLSVVGWDGVDWQNEYLVGSAGGYTPSSMQYDDNGIAHIGYLSPDRQQLHYGTWDGAQWQAQTVVQLSGGDLLGEQVVLMLDDNGWPLLVFSRWLSGVHSLWLARWNGAAWQTFSHLAGQPLGATSYIDAALSGQADISAGEGKVYASYYEQGQGDLHLAAWDVGNPNNQTDGLVDAGFDTGLFNRITTDVRLENGNPVDVVSIAYFDATHQNIMYAHNEAGWTHQVAIYNTGSISSLDMVLGNDAWLTPYIAYTAQNDNSLRMVHSDDGLLTWPLDIIVDGAAAPPDDVSIAFDFAPRIAFRDETGAIQYAFPASRHNTGPAPASQSTGIGAILGFDGEICLYWSNNASPSASGAGLVSAGPTGLLDDLTVMDQMTQLFAGSTAGQAYIDLYNTHANEMGQIGWSDPDLLWDSYRTLHNLMPGLEAMVLGHGETVTVTQEMADQALDIWQRLAAAGSPALASTINAELAKYNNLQDFVGMTFDEWAETIGVPALEESVYLPIVNRP